MAKKTPTTPNLPGMEDSAIKPIESAASTYEEKRDARLDAGRAEKAAKDKLIQKMKDHDKTTYRRLMGDGTVLTIVRSFDKESVKVSHPDED